MVEFGKKLGYFCILGKIFLLKCGKCCINAEKGQLKHTCSGAGV